MAEIDYRLGDYQQSKNFAEVLANYSPGSGGGAVGDSLVCKFITSVYFNGSGMYTPGSGAHPLFIGTATNPSLPWTVQQQNGTAFIVGDGPDPENPLGPQGLTFTKGGVYLHTLSLTPAGDDRYQPGDVASAKNNFTFAVTDYFFLDTTLVWPYDLSVSNSLNITWTGVYNEGEAAALPTCGNFSGPQPSRLISGSYTAVRLTT